MIYMCTGRSDRNARFRSAATESIGAAPTGRPSDDSGKRPPHKKRRDETRRQDTCQFSLIWQLRMVSSAALCFSGVTPAQQAGSTDISASGKCALSISALLITQISVHRPISSTENSSPRAASRMRRGRVTEPKVRFFTARKPFFSSASAMRASSRWPGVPFMQCGTGRLRPSLVCI